MRKDYVSVYHKVSDAMNGKVFMDSESSTKVGQSRS